MATTQQIARLRLILGPNVLQDADLDQIIDLTVPEGGTDPDLLEAEAIAWETAAARYHALVDVSESGSSRSLSQMHKNAMLMATSVRKRIADLTVEAEVEVKRPTGTRRIVRI